MTKSMVPDHRFEFEERTKCLCGAPLQTSPEPNELREKKYSWGDIKFLKCRTCKSWVQSPKISVNSISKWFDSLDYQEAGADKEGVYVSYSSGEAGRLAEARHRYEKELKPKLRPGASVLEIGCATAPNLKVLKDEGYKVQGIDLSSKFAEQAKEIYNVDVKVGELTSLDPEEYQFDLILLYGTFVNFTDPVGQLTHIRKLLKEGGSFCFNVPVSNSFVAKLYGEKCWMFTPSGSTFPTVDGCRKALELAGFKVTNLKRDYQAPTVSKVVSLTGLKKLYPLVDSLGLSSLAPPIPLPIPMIRQFWCEKSLH